MIQNASRGAGVTVMLVSAAVSQPSISDGTVLRSAGNSGSSHSQPSFYADKVTASLGLMRLPADRPISVVFGRERADEMWFEQNKPEILANFEGRFVAILGRKVIDADVNSRRLLNRVVKAHGEVEFFVAFAGVPSPSPAI